MSRPGTEARNERVATFLRLVAIHGKSHDIRGDESWKKNSGCLSTRGKLCEKLRTCEGEAGWRIDRKKGEEEKEKMED